MDTDKTSAAASGYPDACTASKQKSFVRERRAFVRYSIEAQASIVLVKSGSVLRGNILDLSLGGCRIHCHGKFPVGIYTRVETEFCVAGMPFRLAGVIQGVHGANDVGIRFLDMSSRKRDQLELLLHEIEEKLPKPPAACEGAAEPQS